MISSFSSVNSTPQPTPSTAKKSFLRRILPALLVANVAVGVYVLLMTSKKPKKPYTNGEATEEVISAPAAHANITEKKVPTESPAPLKVLPPIPEEEQRELYKWMLEEMRKMKPQNASEKKRIDEEKALLKEVIRAKSIPSL